MSSSSGNRPGNSGGKTRLDVSSAGPSLTQNPFAKLAQSAIVPATGAPAEATPKKTAEPLPAVEKKTKRGRLLLRRETKHRGGKAVVIVSGFSSLPKRDDKTIGEVEKLLKQRLGCGGSIDSQKQEVLIQGDRPEDVAALLAELGFEVGGVISKPAR